MSLLTLHAPARDRTATPGALAAVATRALRELEPDQQVVGALAGNPNTPWGIDLPQVVDVAEALRLELAAAHRDARERVLACAQTATLTWYLRLPVDRFPHALFVKEPDVVDALANRVLGRDPGTVVRAVETIVNRPDASVDALRVALDHVFVNGRTPFGASLRAALTRATRVPDSLERWASSAAWGRDVLERAARVHREGGDPYQARVKDVSQGCGSDVSAWADAVLDTGDGVVASTLWELACKGDLAQRTRAHDTLGACALLRGTHAHYATNRTTNVLPAGAWRSPAVARRWAAAADSWTAGHQSSILPPSAGSDDIERAMDGLRWRPAPDDASGLVAWHIARLSMHPAATREQRTRLTQAWRRLAPAAVDGDEYTARQLEVAGRAVGAPDATAWALSVPLPDLRDAPGLDVTTLVGPTLSAAWQADAQAMAVAVSLEAAGFSGSLSDLLITAGAVTR